MRRIGHFIGNEPTFDETFSAVFDPATGRQVAEAAKAGRAGVDRAVAAARAAFSTWSTTGLQSRATMMLELRSAVQRAKAELISLVIEEAGKTVADATAEVERAVEVLGQAASAASWYGTSFSPHVSRGVDAYEVRYPIGVIAAISPFNFPVLIPVVQSATAIACGNTIVIKPSDRDPSATVRIAELCAQAGLPPGVLNVVLGDKSAVERLVEHPDVAGISFVGSTDVARQLRVAGVTRNKRVQTFGSGKNHLVVLPDADLDLAADAAISGAFGAAGQRCMAVSVIVAVGDIGDALVQKIAQRLKTLKTGDPADASTDVGPVISPQSRERIRGYLQRAATDGARIVAGNAAIDPADGWFVEPCILDHVRPGAAAHTDEIFGPVLSIVRVPSFAEAMQVIAGHALGNGAAIYTRDGGAARRFVDEVEAGQVGVNIPIPFPAFFHNFAGWKDSAFTETKLFGPGALAFCTRTKTVSARWPQDTASRIDLGFPMPH